MKENRGMKKDLENKKVLITGGAGENLIKNHVLWGDRKRMNFDEKIKINKSWRDELNFFQKIAIDFVTFPLIFYKNYKFK